MWWSPSKSNEKECLVVNSGALLESRGFIVGLVVSVAMILPRFLALRHPIILLKKPYKHRKVITKVRS